MNELLTLLTINKSAVAQLVERVAGSSLTASKVAVMCP